MARTICDWVPSVEKVRMCNSGTEATMSAIRLARGFTKRDYIVKFDGCYHGHSDSLLVAAGSGALTHGEPDSAGVPKAFAEKTIVLPYNDPEALETLFAARGEEIAAIIVESYPANAGLVFPKPGYLDLLSSITKKHGALLIFDEVMTGFRLGKAGVQGLENLTPDLSCFGKVIGGGLPVGAFGGRADVMDHARADRSGLSGGHAQRQSAGDGGRPGAAPGAGQPLRLRAAGAARRAFRKRPARSFSRKRACRTASTASARCSACSSPTGKSSTCPT